MRQLLFGGTFDPPHWGHISLLKNAIEVGQPDRVVIIPAGIPPHKQASSAPAPLRLAMCACFCSVFPRVSIWDYEIMRQEKSYTVDTIKAFLKEHPGDELLLCIGGDMLLSFADWYCYKEILALVTLVVQSRGEERAMLEKAADKLRNIGGQVLFTEKEVERVSSTEIRAGLRNGEDFWSMLPPPADKIARKNGLYRR